MKRRQAQTKLDERSPIDDRWVDRAEGGGLEARAGALLRQASQREPLEAGRLAAIGARLRRERQRPERRHWMLRVAICVGLVASGGALTAAAERYLRNHPRARPAPLLLSPPAPARARTPSRVAPPAPAPAAVVQPMPQSAEPPPGTVGAPKSAAARRLASVDRARIGQEPATPAKPPSVMAEEAALVAEALRKLRRADDANGALALLDLHDQRFPTGPLAPEATLARIEALVRARRVDDALFLLDRTTPAPRGRGRDLLAARAELRATAGRQAAAADDFDQLLAGPPVSDAITERALWGRAACRAARGDAAGARRDLQDYLARFPEGRFAGEAREALRP